MMFPFGRWDGGMKEEEPRVKMNRMEESQDTQLHYVIKCSGFFPYLCVLSLSLSFSPLTLFSHSHLYPLFSATIVMGTREPDTRVRMCCVGFVSEYSQDLISISLPSLTVTIFFFFPPFGEFLPWIGTPITL
jgi:hypothetical protein